jgi:hypothetical protein
VAAPIAALDVSGGANIVSTGSSTTATALTTTGRVGVNVAAPIAALDVSGGANIVSTGSSTTATALTTTGWVGVNKTPSVALDVAGAASISGNLNMNSNRIFGLPDSPTADNDATSKKYVDTSLTSGSIVNNPSVTRNDAMGNNIYLTGMLDTTLPGNGVTARGNLYVDSGLYYNPSANTLYATTFNGALTGNVTGNADTATRSIGSQFRIGAAFSDPVSSLYIKNPDSTLNEGIAQIRLESTNQNTESILDIGVWKGQAYFYNKKNTGIGFGTDNTQRMTITGAGLVGIGAGTPEYALTVFGGVNNYAGVNKAFLNFTGFGRSNYTWSITIRAEYGILVGADIVLSSDKRIKKNVKDIDGNTALSQIRQIRPKIYNYIDYNTKGSADVYGFIAQDVKDVILNSTTLTKDYIPNFYCQGNICVIDASNHIYEISSENDLLFEKVIDDSGNEVLFHNVKIYGYDNTQYICHVLQMNNTKNIRVKLEKEYKFADDEENKYKIFIYGQQIYDFHCLEKNAVWTVATAALQEVDRQQQADKIRIAELDAKVAEQQSLINDILERLKTLEKV